MCIEECEIGTYKKLDRLLNCIIIFLLTLLTGFYLCSCTYSINMVHTEGQASDVVDEQQEPKADISPNINIPL